MTMKTYLVGGAVRDTLLGRPSQDHDYVVVGATPVELQAQGFTPIGKDFPVFLHPKTKHEYALARTERKTAQGYAGFAFHTDPSVTLEEDLARRDLTINAMAQAADGALIDPYGGQADLAAKLLRHVSPAFAEDPVRILRIARFAARLDFAIAPETLHLMRHMVEQGEVNALVAERTWQELSKGLMERLPLNMLNTLAECGALPILVPLWAQQKITITRLWQELREEHHAACTLEMRFALWSLPALPTTAHIDIPEIQLKQHAKQLRTPNLCSDLLIQWWRVVQWCHAHRGQAHSAENLLQLFRQCDAFRQPQRFATLAALAEMTGWITSSDKWLHPLHRCQHINTAEIAARTAQAFPQQPHKIAEAIDAARLNRIANT
jgi:tRNA nucleotidyltransferase (CCA-adding enzyme)